MTLSSHGTNGRDEKRTTGPPPKQSRAEREPPAGKPRMTDRRAAPAPAPGRRRRRRPPATTPGLLWACVALAALRAASCDGFAPARPPAGPPPRPRGELVRLRSSVLDAPPSSAGGGALSGFQRRMRGLVAGRRPATGGREAARPANMRTVHTLEEYRDALAESDGIVVTKFHATWCKVSFAPSREREPRSNGFDRKVL